MPPVSINLKMLLGIRQFDIICTEIFMSPTEHFYERNVITKHCLNKELGRF